MRPVTTRQCVVGLGLALVLGAACKDSAPVADLGRPGDAAREQPAPSTCGDGLKDGDETSVDCGGSCPQKCSYNQACLEDGDCQSGSCDPSTKKCKLSGCSDGLKDGDETDVDCGGSCTSRCGNGQDCLEGADCQSGSCDPSTGTCKMTACSDGLEDGDETDVDCGGSCPARCGDGQGCAVDGDCQSGSCDSSTKKCKATACSDGLKDGDETDVDCGGSCPKKCGVNQGCATGADCQSGSCDPSTKKCKETACSDGKKDGDETAVDCGGSCSQKCALGQGCAKDGDCQSGSCDPATKTCKLGDCSDGLKDGDETAVDCGGSCSQKCALGQGCAKDGDCQSGSCDPATKTCKLGDCSDGLKDGDETAVDCGGSCPSKCTYNQGCAKDADCQSGSCDPTTNKCL